MMVVFAACGDKEDDSKPDSNLPESLAHTAWHCTEPNCTVWLLDETAAKFHQIDQGEHFRWNGTYTYDATTGSGSMTFKVDYVGNQTVTYTLKDDQMTVTQYGQQYVMKKMEWDDPDF